LVPWITQRDVRFYDEPERFDPDRWRGDPTRSGRLPREPLGVHSGAHIRACLAGIEQLPLDVASEAQNKTAIISGPLVASQDECYRACFLASDTQREVSYEGRG
jgi:hypothetical protein